MNSVLEKQESKLFQPLRNNIIPKYIILNTTCINYNISYNVESFINNYS